MVLELQFEAVGAFLSRKRDAIANSHLLVHALKVNIELTFRERVNLEIFNKASKKYITKSGKTRWIILWLIKNENVYSIK